MTDYSEIKPPSPQQTKSTFGHTEGHTQLNAVQPTSIAIAEQTRQSLRAALTEIEELKSSQRVVEISLAKQIEEKEALKRLLAESEKRNDVGIKYLNNLRACNCKSRQRSRNLIKLILRSLLLTKR